jgi:hypothetical protein
MSYRAVEFVPKMVERRQRLLNEKKDFGHSE